MRAISFEPNPEDNQPDPAPQCAPANPGGFPTPSMHPQCLFHSLSSASNNLREKTEQIRALRLRFAPPPNNVYNARGVCSTGGW